MSSIISLNFTRARTIIVSVLLSLTFMFCQVMQPGRTDAVTGVVLSDPLTVRWKYESNLTLNLTPAFDRDRIYLPLAGGTIVSLNAKDGQLFWRSEMGGQLSASPVADDSSIYVASEIIDEGG